MSTKPKAETQARPISPVDNMRAEAAAESRRIAGIRKVCAGKHADDRSRRDRTRLESVTKTELAVLRSERPKAPEQSQHSAALHSRSPRSRRLLVGRHRREDAAGQLRRTDAQAADPMRHIGLRELVAECAAWKASTFPRVFGDGTATIRAGFSSMSLPGIMENVMNKTLLAAYQNTPIAAFDLCSVGTVTDFKEVSRYRLLGTGGFEQVAPDGELKHGKLSEQKYTQQGRHLRSDPDADSARHHQR